MLKSPWRTIQARRRIISLIFGNTPTPTPPAVAGDRLQLETGDYMLQETSDFILLDPDWMLMESGDEYLTESDSRNYVLDN